MIKIRNLADMENLNNRDSVSNPCREYLKAYFYALNKAYNDDEDPSEFALDDYGCSLTLLEQDDQKIMQFIMESPMTPEYVEKVKLTDQSQLYKIAMMPDNECMIFFFVLASQLSDEHMSWLEEQVQKNESVNKV